MKRLQKIAEHPWFVHGILIAWMVLNGVQSITMELFHDEAYYWMYAENLSWGYAEHPPMVAGVIRLGTIFFSGEFGVRFIPILLGAGTLWLIWKMTDEKNPILFFAIAFSMVMVHLGGFFAAPDSPYIFFVACFFYQYKRYLEKDDLLRVILLSLSGVAVLYSKYHGGMVVFFTVISHLKLFKKRSFWGVFGLAFLLYLPHLFWLAGENFETFRFHLTNRPQGSFPFEPLLNYLGGQLLFAGPFMSIPILWAGFRYKKKGLFEKALKFVFAGILGFVCYMSIRGWTEANWTAGAYIPGLIICYQFAQENINWRKWIFRLAIPSIVLLMVFRLYLSINFLPELRSIKKEFHGWEAWAKQVSELAQGDPVVFVNSFQKPSKYMFYEGGLAHSLNNFNYHHTGYDDWGGEAAIQGKKVLYMDERCYPDCDIMVTVLGDKHTYRFVEDFRSYSQLKIKWNTHEAIFSPDTVVTLSLHLVNHHDFDIDFEQNPDRLIHLNGLIHQDQDILVAGEICLTGIIEANGGSREIMLDIRTPKESGSYQMIVTLLHDWYYPSVNGDWIEIQIGK